MDVQINNYARSLANKFGTEEEIHRTREGNGSGKRQIADGDRRAYDSRLAREYVREWVQAWLNSHLILPEHNFKIIQLRLPGWQRPPLSFCDTTGQIVGHIKYTSHEFASLDNAAKRGVALMQWIRDNLHLACGSDREPGEEFFRCGLSVYVDQFGDVFILPINRSDSIIDGAIVLAQSGRGYVHLDSMEATEEYRQGVKYDDFTAAQFIPSNYWWYIGRIPEHKMVNISTSWAAKWRIRYPNREIIYPSQKLEIYRANLKKPIPKLQFEELRVINLD